MVDFETSSSKSEFKFVENYYFLENDVTSEGAVSHNVLYHQPIPITRHQERFYANNYFESSHQTLHNLGLILGLAVRISPCKINQTGRTNS